MSTFTCERCGKSFTVPQAALDRYPGWKPRTCLDCRGDGKGTRGKKSARAPRAAASRFGAAELLTPEQVLQRYHDGPSSGLFTDGSASPNPGPGGWAAVWVQDGQLVEQRHGQEPHTTNNRMELRGLIEAYRLTPPGQALDVYSDSELCVKTMTQWAKGWKARGWKRKSGPIKNLELVQELYALVEARPELRLRWIKAHDGSRWNEYADALASSYMRGE